ncbi:MAG TPA: response regulator [Rhodopila sp.]|jgi:CheY-like chemotaxis protein
MTQTASHLHGKRVLVVEDEALVAMLIEDCLEGFGCDVVGPCNTVEAALEAARTQAFDVAVLDVNLRGSRVYPVAELLTDRHIPFLFLSGYGDEAIPPDRPGWTVCAKPFRVNDLERLLSAALAPGVQ